MSTVDLVAAERRDLLALLRELSPAEWETPSLCAGWQVRDVVAHLVGYEGRTPRQMLDLAVRGRFVPDRMNAVGVRELAGRTPEELVRRLADHLEPTGPAALFGGRVGITDGVIHHQDIRRAVGRPRAVPAERLLPALSFALTAPPLRGAWRARGTRLVAEDVGWTHGRGPEVRGPGEAVLMAMAGRRDALRDLRGAGVDRLADRLPRVSGGAR